MTSKLAGIGFVALLVLLAGRDAGATPSADEAPVRVQRPLLVSGSFDALQFAGENIPIPLVGVRLAYNVNERLAIDLGGGAFGYVACGGCSFTGAHAGARWTFRDRALAPYAMAHVGFVRDGGDQDSPGGRIALYAVAGLGLEYADDAGFDAWIEAGVGVADHSARAVTEVASAGVGYRFGR